MIQNSNFDIRWLTWTDVQDGFKILAPSPILIPWKTDPRELLFHHSNLVSEVNGNGLSINYPIQIGKIIVKENNLYKKHGWAFPLYISGKGIKVYTLVKSALEVMMQGIGYSKDEYTGGYFARFYISRSKLAFRLEYPLPSDSHTHIQFTTFDGCLLSIEFNSLVSHESKKDRRRNEEHTYNYRREHGY